MRPSGLLFFGGILALCSQPTGAVWATAKHWAGPFALLPSFCRLPPEGGPCLALFTHWYYDAWARRCLTFTYGGCRGNANNFETRAECERKCLYPEFAAALKTKKFLEKNNAFLTPAPRPTPKPAKTTPEPETTTPEPETTTPEPETTTPEPEPSPFKPGTCPILNEGNSTMCGEFCITDASCPGNEKCCETSCGHQCHLPINVNPGYCPKEPERTSPPCADNCTVDLDCGWGSRVPKKKCCKYRCRHICREAKEEHPGVCPKMPVVQTFAPCNDSCSDDRDCPLEQKCCFTGCSLGCLDPVRSQQCQLPPERGPCRAAIRRYFHSPLHKACLPFYYGGCRGNANNFKTEEECQQACGKISPDVCKLPKQTGGCLSYSEFFYYNSTTSSCEKSAFCGCKVNGNQFRTQLECQMVCGIISKSD